ncbi:hypothetical protein V5F53_11630 [Xanthobacter sp. V4C-4]
MVAAEVKNLANDTKPTLSQTQEAIGGMERSLDQLGAIIAATHGQFEDEERHYRQTIEQVERLFDQSGVIGRTLDDLGRATSSQHAEIAEIDRQMSRLKQLE